MTAPADAELEPLVLPEVTRELLALYARASGDLNPLHLDPEAARRAGEPDVIAHGMLTMGLVGRLLGERLPGRRLLRWSVRFVAKTPVGSQITCRARPATAAEPGETGFDVWAELADGTVTVRGHAVLGPADTSERTA